MNSANNKKTAALIIGFGGPTKAGEVQPFLQSILEGSAIPPSRLEEVTRHYEVIGGCSPFNAVTLKQKEALERYFTSRSMALPVGVAFRHSTPTFKDAFEMFKKFGVRKVVAFVMASFRSFVSSEWYREKALQGRALAQAETIEIVYTEAFDRLPLYLGAQADRIHSLWSSRRPKEKEETVVIYTAHSIPASMCEQSCRENKNRCYGSQFYEAATTLSERLGLKNWFCAYQSRTGNPRDRWMEPDVKEVIQTIDTKKFKSVLLAPIGFLTDNVEVIYDLDIEARDCCLRQGLEYLRVPMVADHPKFIEMMGSQILEKI